MDRSEEEGTELSDGELPNDGEDETSGNDTHEDGEIGASAKRMRREMDTSQDDEGGEWKVPTKRQQKKMAKKSKRKVTEKKKHQDKEDKYAITMSKKQLDSNAPMLGTRQTEVLEALSKIAHGDQSAASTIQKLKTVQFQQIITSLIIGSPLPLFSRESLEKVREEYRVAVVWISMVSSEFFHAKSEHFSGLKKLNPSVVFNIEHPGSRTFVQLGLESFMMNTNHQGSGFRHDGSTASADRSEVKPRRYHYMLSLEELTDNDFPNLSRGDVDQLGRDVGGYVGIKVWPSCEIKDMVEVEAAREGTEDLPLFAIDCEMVQTKNGSELARISVVDEDLKCVYDTYVKPADPVLDYRTRYSGISETTLADVTTSLEDVQQKLMSILPPNSILIGHSLENDFHALKFRHPLVIDTSLLFTAMATPTCKPGLRKLTKELLSTDIHNTDQGHDSIEDATMCMKLVVLKLKRGVTCKIAFNEISPSIFTEYRTKGCSTGIVDKESIIRVYGRGSSHTVEVGTDEEAVAKGAEIISLSKFTFLQLHSMEYLLKSASTNGQVTAEKQLETAHNLDKLLMEFVKNCPSKTIVFVVCGSSDIRKVRALQQQEFTNVAQLTKEVFVARTGCVVGFVIQ